MPPWFLVPFFALDKSVSGETSKDAIEAMDTSEKPVERSVTAEEGSQKEEAKMAINQEVQVAAAAALSAAAVKAKVRCVFWTGFGIFCSFVRHFVYTVLNGNTNSFSIWRLLRSDESSHWWHNW